METNTQFQCGYNMHYKYAYKSWKLAYSILLRRKLLRIVYQKLLTVFFYSLSVKCANNALMIYFVDNSSGNKIRERPLEISKFFSSSFQNQQRTQRNMNIWLKLHNSSTSTFTIFMFCDHFNFSKLLWILINIGFKFRWLLFAISVLFSIAFKWKMHNGVNTNYNVWNTIVSVNE